ncbi:MAG: ABC transporter permease [Deltaproteobacteria bacterium]|nr:ABC transporter permease [Deltaproteobacteria bacterium]
MKSYIVRAFRDINDNRFLNGVAVLTIALSVLIAGAFSLIWTNLNHWMTASESNVRIMVYLKEGATEAQSQDTTYRIQGLDGVQKVQFISRSQALSTFKAQLKHQASLLDGLGENPLPDSLEVELKNGAVRLNQIEPIATQITRMPAVESVEYGQEWMERFANLLSLFRFAGMILGGIFFIASGLIVANTARLVLYSRRDEVEIMRLVGATDLFIKAPFYIEGLIQGASGGGVGLFAVYAAYLFMSSKLTSDLASGFWRIHFLSIESIGIIIGCSIGIGLIGCFLSMKQFFRN